MQRYQSWENKAKGKFEKNLIEKFHGVFFLKKRSFKFENPIIFILMEKFKERNFILNFILVKKRVDFENVLRKLYLKFSWVFFLKKKVQRPHYFCDGRKLVNILSFSRFLVQFLWCYLEAFQALISSNLISLEISRCLVSIGSDLAWFGVTVIKISCLVERWCSVGNFATFFLVNFAYSNT